MAIALVGAGVLAGWLAMSDPEKPAATAAEGAVDAETVRRLEALGYAQWHEISGTDAGAGVVHHEPERSWPGMNLYVSLHEAYLMDLAGTRVHTWTHPAQLPPGLWIHAEPLPDGSILVVLLDQAVAKLSFDSELLWSTPLRAHHDLALAADGRIWALHRKDEVVDFAGRRLPVLVDYLALLSPDGRLERDISLLPALRPFIAPASLAQLAQWTAERQVLAKLAGPLPKEGFLLRYDSPADLFHTNAVEVIDRDLPGFARSDDLLISARQLHLIGALEPASSTLRSHWGPGKLERQHHPSVLPNGNLLMFDNGFSTRFWSRVIEVEPEAGAIVWQYPAQADRNFFSSWGGSSEALPNGNLLITETTKGRIFELTPDGDVVWDYLNPSVRDRWRETIYRATRLGPDRFPFLDRLEPGARSR